ncbi:glycine/sarcosine N-methyltransferase [Saccharomonospora iraqiensis]|uniref:glycine/sarcosine N-methyltransferase n=1 Tax=Saccharomonospora iraqiensis TaxID=52698 RepID=UPI00022E0428|nr:class I SAM-dependent methyltransferase [Saccharomonospora iraqiensis]
METVSARPDLTSTRQTFGDHPLAVRETDHYTREYVGGLVEKWDDLIDWDRRAEAEGTFFLDQLRGRGARTVLDAAAGTGFHSVRLREAGFDTVSADGSPQMLARAFENGLTRGQVLHAVNADWRTLGRDVPGVYDALVCLGNSFTHLFSEHDRRRTLAEFYAKLDHDGVLIIDQRNYDAILDGRAGGNRTYYYCGTEVTAAPEHVDEGLARYRYTFADGGEYHLNMCPLRRDYLRTLLREAGFGRVETYGDFRTEQAGDEPDYFIHVAEKRYAAEPDDTGRDGAA